MLNTVLIHLDAHALIDVHHSMSLLCLLTSLWDVENVDTQWVIMGEFSICGENARKKTC